MKDQSVTVDLRKFDTQGYFIARGLLDPETDLRPIKEEYSVLLDALAEKWYKEGKVASTYRGLPFTDRICKFTSEGQDCLRHFDIILPSSCAADTPDSSRPCGVQSICAILAFLMFWRISLAAKSTRIRSSTSA